jgi:hypothetical protein
MANRSLLLLPVLLSALCSTSIAQAAPAVFSAPKGGECLKGGSNVQIIWGAGAADHGALAFTSSAAAPASWIENPASYFAYPVAANVNWTVPAVTINTAYLWADSLDALDHTSMGVVSSNPFSIDSTPPTKPVLIKAEQSGSGVTLNWSPSVDLGCQGLTGYKVYRADTSTLLATLEPAATTYAIAGLPSGSYAYSVVAYDHDYTAESLPVTVIIAGTATTTPTPQPTAAPSATPLPAPVAVTTAKPSPKPIPSATPISSTLDDLSTTSDTTDSSAQNANPGAAVLRAVPGITAVPVAVPVVQNSSSSSYQRLATTLLAVGGSVTALGALLILISQLLQKKNRVTDLSTSTYPGIPA